MILIPLIFRGLICARYWIKLIYYTNLFDGYRECGAKIIENLKTTSRFQLFLNSVVVSITEKEVKEYRGREGQDPAKFF